MLRKSIEAGRLRQRLADNGKTWEKVNRSVTIVESNPFEKWWLGMEEVVYIGPSEGTILNLNGDWIQFEKHVPVRVNGLQAQKLLRTNQFKKVASKDKLRFACEKKSHPRVYIIRGGGMGDIILLSATLRKLKEIYPNLEITLATDENHHCLLRREPYLTELVRMHRTLAEYDRMDWTKWDSVFNINMYVEHSELYPTTHRMDIFAEAFDVVLEEKDRVPAISIEPIYEEFANQTLIDLGWDPRVPLVTLQLRGMAATRTLPTETNQRVAELLVRTGYQVCLIDRERIGWEGPGILNATGVITQVGVIAGVLQKAICHFGPDSGVAHLAAALGRKVTVCTTTVPANLRYTYYNNIVVLEPTVPSFPCYEGSCPGCACIHNFSAEQIVEAVNYTIYKAPFGCEVYRVIKDEKLRNQLKWPSQDTQPLQMCKQGA